MPAPDYGVPQTLPYPEITPIGNNKPAAGPALWNSRYTEITQNFVALLNMANGAVKYDTLTGGAYLPKGTTEQRGDPDAGKMRFNETSKRFEGANGESWGSLGGATGGGNDAIFYENQKVITADYTLTTNAVTAGGIEIAEGVTVTINPGNSWAIV